MRPIAWDCPLEEVATCMLEHVVAVDCTQAFSQEQILSAVQNVHRSCHNSKITQELEDAVRRQRGGVERATLKGDKAVQLLAVLGILAETSKMAVSDVLGQILWQHRTTQALRAPCFRSIGENFGWVDAAAVGLAPTNEVTQMVTDVFNVLTTTSGGRMRPSAWLKIIQILETNPVLQPRLRRSDAHRLFYTQTRQSKQCWAGICGAGFLRLLVELADAMQAHPVIVFLAVGSHAGSLAETVPAVPATAEV